MASFRIFLKARENSFVINADSVKSESGVVIFKRGDKEIGRFILNEVQGYYESDKPEK